jgi:hypothetical protein
LTLEKTRSDHFLFGSVFIKKKSNQTEFKKKNKTKTETNLNRPVLVRFGFLGKKPVQTGFGLVWLGLARFFFRFGFGSVFSIFLLTPRKNYQNVVFLEVK